MDLHTRIDELIGEVSGFELDMLRDAANVMLTLPPMPGHCYLAFSTSEGVAVAALEEEDIAELQAIESPFPVEELRAYSVPAFTNFLQHPEDQRALRAATAALVLQLKAPPVPNRIYFGHVGRRIDNQPFVFVFAGRLARAH